MKIKVGVSNRHVHLCKEDADILFGKDYQFEKRNDLSQEGEYACMETVIVSTDQYEFPHVRVMGPLRNYTQVEVSEDDAGDRRPLDFRYDAENGFVRQTGGSSVLCHAHERRLDGRSEHTLGHERICREVEDRVCEQHGKEHQ